MTTPPNAPEVDVLATIEDAAICLENWGEIHEARDLRTAVAALLTREAALVARNAELAAELAARDARLKIPRNPIERYLFDALKQYPSKNPQRTQASKVCAGVLKLACEMAENDLRELAVKDNKTLLDVAHALMLLVEGPGCARWEDGHGFRLKDMPEWAAFYCAVKACALERDTIAAERDALAAEVGALREACEFTLKYLNGHKAMCNEDQRAILTSALAARAEAGHG